MLARLAVHGLDLVLANNPVGPSVKVRAFNHQLGECSVTIFVHGGAEQRDRRHFPRSLDGAPFLLPTETTTLRRLDDWFEAESIRPVTVESSMTVR